MVIRNVTVNDCTPETIVIGRRGTFETMQIVFDLTYLIENYGDGTAVLALKRSQDSSAYPAVTAQDGNTLTWVVSEVDTYYVGAGVCQLMWYVDDGLAKTIIYPMVVMKDILSTAEEPPDGYENWIEHLTDLGAETLQNAQNAAQSASDAESAKDDAVTAKEAAEEAAETAQEAVVHAPIIQNGYWYIWNDGQYVDTGVRAEGQKGDKGDTGEKGDTGNGIASITKTGTSGLVDTYTVTYTDGTTTTFTVTNGAKGDKGDTGATGNGIQSITKTGTSGNVDTYTITYTNGQTTTFTVTNGAVSSVAGKTGAVTLDANDVAFSDSGTYDDGTVGKELSNQKNAISELNRQLSDVESVLFDSENTLLPNTLVSEYQYSNGYIYKVSNIVDGTTTLSQVLSVGSTGSKAFKISLDYAIEITYPLFKTTGGYGSFICDENNVVIWHYAESIKDGGTLETIKVPDGASFMILSLTSGFFDGTINNWYVKLIYPDVHRIYSDVESLDTQMQLYTDKVIGEKYITDSISWVENYAIKADGSLETNPNFHYTNLIPVTDGLYKFTYKGVGSNNNTRIHAYDSNGQWLEQIVLSSSGTVTTPITVNIPCKGYSYIKISTAKVTTVQYLITPSLLKIPNSNGIGLHTEPENEGVLNAIKRARQFTDLVWTSGADIPRAFMDTGDTYLTSHSQVYQGTFTAGKQYKGLPYSDKEQPYRWLGIEVPIEAFCSAVQKDNSVIALESQYSQYGADYYGCVCTSLTSYALDLPYTYAANYSNINGMSKVANVSGIDASVIKLGDILQISGHAAIITDIFTDDFGAVTFIEISEQTRQGNTNRSNLTGEYGSVCRRITMTVPEFKEWFDGFSLYRYAYIDKVPYRSCPYVPMPDEGNRICIHDYPLMPYMGNKTTYATNTAPIVKIIFDTDDYTTLVVYKNETLFSKYDVENQTYYDVVCDTDEAKYTACLAVLDGNQDISYSTQSVEWYCRPHDTPVVSVSGGKATISVTNKGGFKPYCVELNTSFIDGRYTKLFDSDYTKSTSGGDTTYTFQIPFSSSEETSCKLYLRSEEWGVCEYNFTITP